MALSTLTMSLVAYPDSDSEDDVDRVAGDASPRVPAGSPNAALKRKRSHVELPPLPSTFLDLYATNARVSTDDDPSLHGGRKRAMPHVEGNWPSHVYLEWIPLQSESEHLHKLIADIQKTIEDANKKRSKKLPVPDITPSLLSPLETPLPLHISLSRTLQIKTDERTHFLDALKSELKKGAANAFTIRFAGLKWVPNYQRNRWFLVLSIAKPPNDDLNTILTACNSAAQKCGHPALYTGTHGDGPMDDNPSSNHPTRTHRASTAADEPHRAPDPTDRTDNFHISIAWNLAPPAPEWLEIVRNFDTDAYIKNPETPFDVVKTKIGNAIHSIEMARARNAKIGGTGGLLGLG